MLILHPVLACVGTIKDVIMILLYGFNMLILCLDVLVAADQAASCPKKLHESSHEHITDQVPLFPSPYNKYVIYL